MRYPVTPDGRYFVVRGRLWRVTNPKLPEDQREQLVAELMRARNDLRRSKGGSDEDRADARRRVHEAKVGLGERGPVWWTDGAPDYNRHLAKNTSYKEWFESLNIET
ncbi:MAG: hypothetical protein EOP84_19125 [Verrucomicrobiaceae bacterium]|nr:MAG: hypothetical protein EOP84_19125 [Verrucomicrobiaceae bacterium]